MTITVLLADDHAVVRDGLRMLLNAQPDIEVIGEAAEGNEAVREATRLCPDVAVIDIAMPSLNGIEAAWQIRDGCPDVRVVILSMYSTSEHIYRALQAGALGFVLKESAGGEVVNAVRAVSAGRRFLSPKIIPVLTGPLFAPSPLARLSPREREVMQLVVEGWSSAQIADHLALSPKTVETYRSRLMKKLGVEDIPSLVKFAVQHGITPLE